MLDSTFPLDPFNKYYALIYDGNNFTTEAQRLTELSPRNPPPQVGER
jgi:hypothetical protein